jgi:murein L,D-transpeptidase YcbB/YkuD
MISKRIQQVLFLTILLLLGFNVDPVAAKSPLMLPDSSDNAALRQGLENYLPTSQPAWSLDLTREDYIELTLLQFARNGQQDNLQSLLQHPLNALQQAMLGKYIAYQLLADSGLWCAQDLLAQDQEQLAYKLWLHEDLDSSPITEADCEAFTVLPVSTEQPQYSDELDAAIRRFQTRHQLAVDGVVGPATLRALNQSPQHIADRILYNLQRSLQQSDRHQDQRYIVVNIPAFELNLFEDGHLALQMRTIVGRRSRPTPEMDLELTTIVMNPSWNVPGKLAYKDIIPKIIKNADYLQQQNIQVLDGWGRNATELDPASIDWELMRQEGFPYRFRQRPGPNNALGLYKFVTPNPRAIFLHDTNSKQLFKRQQRAFSSGCIRLEDPQALAAYLLADKPDSEQQQLQSALHNGTTKAVRLDQPVPVYLTYQTAWVDEFNVLQLRDDIYQLDRAPALPLQIASKN